MLPGLPVSVAPLRRAALDGNTAHTPLVRSSPRRAHLFVEVSEVPPVERPPRVTTGLAVMLQQDAESESVFVASARETAITFGNTIGGSCECQGELLPGR
jgi:hypothetical protein